MVFTTGDLKAGAVDVESCPYSSRVTDTEQATSKKRCPTVDIKTLVIVLVCLAVYIMSIVSTVYLCRMKTVGDFRTELIEIVSKEEGATAQFNEARVSLLSDLYRKGSISGDAEKELEYLHDFIAYYRSTKKYVKYEEEAKKFLEFRECIVSPSDECKEEFKEMFREPQWKLK